MANRFEIPEELEGISEEIALEIMREAAELEGAEQPDSRSAAGESAGIPVAATVTAVSDEGMGLDAITPESAGFSAPATTQSMDNGDEKDKMVPLAALHDERRRRQENDKKLAALEAELEQMRAARTQPVSGQAVMNGQQQSARLQLEADEQRQQAGQYRRQLIQFAKEQFKEENGREPDVYANEDDNAEMTILINELHGKIMDETNRIHGERQAVSHAYHEFASRETAQPEYNAVWNYMLTRVGKLPPMQQQALSETFERATSGTGSMSDVMAIQNLWESSKLMWKAEQQARTPRNGMSEAAGVTSSVEPQPTSLEQKLSQIGKHPRVNQVTGGNSQAGPGVSDLERMLKETDWDKIPAEYQRLLLDE
jgi:hypothetical protein